MELNTVMKSITPLMVTNIKPKILISDKCLNAIKHIVNIAPEEAQWFHTVDVVEKENNVYLHLSDTLYIPKQNTSAAQVNSTSSMMIEFYSELKAEFNDQDIINNKLKSMTCWCHSHHNMAPTPSAQDNTQFTKNINMALNQNINQWQIMLIFNKKNHFYSRVRDPNTGVVFEGVDIVTMNDYDFSYIDKAAREKFLKPKLKPLTVSTFDKAGWGSRLGLNPSYLKSSNASYSENHFQEIEKINDTIVDNIMTDIYPNFHDSPFSSVSLNSKQKAFQALHILDDHLDEKEMHFLYFLLKSTPKKCLTIFTDKRYDKNSLPEKVIRDEIAAYFLSSKQTLSTLEINLKTVLDIVDLPTLSDAKFFLEQI
jgi:hypothetical protein